MTAYTLPAHPRTLRPQPQECQKPMVATGMKRYRVRSAAQASLIGKREQTPLDLRTLFGDVVDHPLRLDIGFGHGEFLAGMAHSHVNERFLGVEQDDLRVTKCAHKCLKANARNIRLFSDEANRFVRFRLTPGCLSAVYILFPDPWPKQAHRRRRLVTRAFLIDLAWAMAPGAQLTFASDTHNYAFQVLSTLTTLPGLWRDLYAPSGYRFDIPTRFPTVFQRHKQAEGCTICYLRQERTATPPPQRLPWLDDHIHEPRGTSLPGEESP
jgi:tRNA (guanine-N7-)-methyltransferase